MEVKTSPVKTSPVKSDAEEFCYCQAANASAKALTMREMLAAQIVNPSQDALVIFSFTCIVQVFGFGSRTEVR